MLQFHLKIIKTTLMHWRDSLKVEDLVSDHKCLLYIDDIGGSHEILSLNRKKMAKNKYKNTYHTTYRHVGLLILI